MPDACLQARPTDWSAVFMAVLMPAAIAAGFVRAALTPQWTESETWVLGLFALVPVEFVRALVYSIVGDAFKYSEGPIQAARSFLLSMLILLILGLIAALYVFGLHDLAVALSDPQILRMLAIPATILVADGIIALYFFRGNPRLQAARIQAAADDLAEWLQLALFPTPFVILFAYGVIRWLRSQHYIAAAWLPEISEETLRCAGLLYAGYYFAGKALVLAYVHTQRFNRSGRRLLSASWVQALTTKPEDRIENARNEASRQKERLSVLRAVKWAG